MTEPETSPPLAYAPTEPPPIINAAMQIRLWSLIIFSISAAMLGLGAFMTPSPHGIGTHAENLHLPPCGFYRTTGIPCPTCGCTTAVTWIAHGNIPQAFFVQPFGAVVGLLAAACVVLGGIGMITGKWLGPQMFTLQWYWRHLMIASSVLLAGGWIYKIIMIKYGFN